MAMLLVLVAETQESDSLIRGEMLEEAESEFLTVVLDRCVAGIKCRALKQLIPISPREFTP